MAENFLIGLFGTQLERMKKLAAESSTRNSSQVETVKERFLIDISALEEGQAQLKDAFAPLPPQEPDSPPPEVLPKPDLNANLPVAETKPVEDPNWMITLRDEVLYEFGPPVVVDPRLSPPPY